MTESMKDQKSAVALEDIDETTINSDNDNQMNIGNVDAEGQLSSEEAALRLQSKIEQQVLKYFQNKEIVSERNEENKMIFEELEELFEELGDDEVVISLPSGQNAVLSLSIREKEVLDVDMLADEMKVPKDELKTPFDFCAFTAKGKLTPAMITKHTSVERDAKLRISKRKASTKRRKKSQS
ncbi:hypothetical protein [Alicyclobacillus mengziensis]|uniref:Uncharacterized protein n=1 Tax=Alicyclobacillus mengziensis TaxID=2931921 RepID=A0A9X7VZV9_9BACL|nr:hypothetical protein [Alicyclobacillus mengziensis]QSO48096.1 hypothetical protein JZ786_03525 [Alicyclobacillus mengziensis]